MLALTDVGRPLVVDIDPAPAGPLELYVEVYPSGELVDGAQRVRMRPAERPSASPGWHAHLASCPSPRSSGLALVPSRPGNT